MVLEYLNGFLSSVAAVVMGRDKLVGHVVTFDGGFELLRAFVVQDVFARLDASTVEMAHEGSVGTSELGIFLVLDGFNECGAAVDFNHHHNVLIARLGTCGELSSLVGENCFTNIIYVDIDILFFSTTELVGMDFIKRFRLGGTNVFLLRLR